MENPVHEVFLVKSCENVTFFLSLILFTQINKLGGNLEDDNNKK